MRLNSGVGRLLLVATMIGFLVSACSSPTSTAPSTPGGVTIATKPYGSLVVGWASGLGALDPQIVVPADFAGLGAAIFDSLLDLTPDTKLTARMAERWEIAADGMSQTYYIRKGVKFHDGSDLTGADVKFSIERILAPEANTTYAPLWRARVAGVDLKDDYTVVIRFKAPQFDLMAAEFQGNSAVVPKKYIEDKGVDYFRKNLMGSGPFKAVKFDRGSLLELEANENYWGEVPKFKNLTFIRVVEESSKVAMLKTGELDTAMVSTDSAAALKSAGLRIKSWDGGQNPYYTLMYDPKNPAQYVFGDMRVRKATSLAVNRKELADKLFQGYATPGIVPNVQATADFFDANLLKADPYDPDGAKKLLAEAGYPSGFQTRIWDSGAGDALSTFTQALAGYFRKVGVDATLVPIERPSLIAMVQPNPKPEVWNSIYTTGVGSSVSQPKFGFDIVSTFQSATGYYKNHANTKLNELIDLYPKTKDPAEKRRVALEASVLAKNEYSAIAVLNIQTTWAVGPKIGDLRPVEGYPFFGAVVQTITHAK